VTGDLPNAASVLAFSRSCPHDRRMKKLPLLTRRNALVGLAAVAAVRPVAATAKVISAAPAPSKAAMVLAADFGLVPDIESDQSAALQKAADSAAARGLPLFLPGGTYRAGNINLTYSVTIYGVDGLQSSSASAIRRFSIRRAEQHNAGFAQSRRDGRRADGQPLGAHCLQQMRAAAF